MLELTFINRNIIFSQNNLDADDANDLDRHVHVLNNHVDEEYNVLLSPIVKDGLTVNCRTVGPISTNANLCHAYICTTAMNVVDENVYEQENRAVHYFRVMFQMTFLIAKMLLYTALYTNQELLL